MLARARFVEVTVTPLTEIARRQAERSPDRAHTAPMCVVTATNPANSAPIS